MFQTFFSDATDLSASVGQLAGSLARERGKIRFFNFREKHFRLGGSARMQKRLGPGPLAAKPVARLSVPRARSLAGRRAPRRARSGGGREAPRRLGPSPAGAAGRPAGPGAAGARQPALALGSSAPSPTLACFVF